MTFILAFNSPKNTYKQNSKSITILIHLRDTHSGEEVTSNRSKNSKCSLSPAGAMKIHSHSVCGGGTLGYRGDMITVELYSAESTMRPPQATDTSR